MAALRRKGRTFWNGERWRVALYGLGPLIFLLLPFSAENLQQIAYRFIPLHFMTQRGMMFDSIFDPPPLLFLG